MSDQTRSEIQAQIDDHLRVSGLVLALSADIEGLAGEMAACLRSGHTIYLGIIQPNAR